MAAPLYVSEGSQAGGQLRASHALVGAVIALFFIWGGLTSLNDILIPKLKGLFSLSYAEAMLTQFAFFMAYFIVSLPAGWLISNVGYLKGIVIGLATMAVGCLMFIPASSSGLYVIFLAALFVMAGGITILQVAANPLIARLGDDATSHSRLTLAQAFNSLGTTLFPPVGALVILGSIRNVEPAMLTPVERADFLAREAAIIGHAYMGIAAVLIVVALFFWFRRNAFGGSGGGEHAGFIQSLTLLSNRRLAGGVASIFLYVGAEVSIGSMLVNFLSQPGVMGLSEQTAGTLIAFYWGGAMVGRFAGVFLLRRFKAGLVLASFCLGAIMLAAMAALGSGSFAGYTILAVGLMNSIMFPTIFSLGVEGLGRKTAQGSGLLCMGIVGGALIPLLVGTVADATTLATALAVPIGCYALIALYGWSARRPA